MMISTSTLRNPHEATDLDDLCRILNEWADAISTDDNEITDYPDDLTSLPVFGGNDVEDTTDVWSWDERSVLVDGEQITVNVSGWDTKPRCTVCGEAHCKHND